MLLVEGARFMAQRGIFDITYTGGTGNDVVVTFVPEPTTALLLASGLVAMAVGRRRGSV